MVWMNSPISGDAPESRAPPTFSGSSRTLRVGTRGSMLALRQAESVRDALKALGVNAEIVEIRTEGDRILDRPLPAIGGKGVFTKEIEDALLEGRIDLAVHSLKDLPTELPQGLSIGAVTARENPRDVFIGRIGAPTLSDLSQGARVGTGSLRRKAQLRAFRPDLEMVDIRGNLDTRLRKLEEGQVDGIVLAAAGFLRLGWTERISQYLPPEVCLPAVGQGALALEAREGDPENGAWAAGLDHPETRRAVEAERALLRRLEGGCQVPIGALAEVANGEICLKGVIASLDGRSLVRGEQRGADPEKVGMGLAEDLLERGGEGLLEEIRSTEGLH